MANTAKSTDSRKSAEVRSEHSDEPESVLPGMETKRVVLIACEVFAQEVRAVLPPEAEVEMVWLEAALHADPAKLEEELLKALSEVVGFVDHHEVIVAPIDMHKVYIARHSTITGKVGVV